VIGRIPLLDVKPRILDGTRPAKAVPSELFPVSATVFREGHDAVAANVVLTDPDGRPDGWHPMRELVPGTDRYEAWVSADREGQWSFHVEAWDDPVATWYHVARAKIPAGQDIEVVFAEGAALLERAAAAETVPAVTEDQEVDYPGQDLLEEVAARLRDESASPEARLALAEGAAVHEALAVRPLREHVTASEPLPLRVDRERALYGSWYEFFPRSEGARIDPLGQARRSAAPCAPRPSGCRRSPRWASTSSTCRRSTRSVPPSARARNNARRRPVRPGLALGDRLAGRRARRGHPELGTIKDFDAFVGGPTELGLEVALDFALQCSPDHPWVEKHPEWFKHRPTAASPTPRTRRRSTRTSTRSTSTPTCRRA
jgi:starch synthase (maltosyl-transferring)